MRRQRNVLIYDRGTTDLQISISVSRYPLQEEKYRPSVFQTFKLGNTDYFVAYWHIKGNKPLSLSQIARIAQFLYVQS